MNALLRSAWEGGFPARTMGIARAMLGGAAVAKAVYLTAIVLLPLTDLTLRLPYRAWLPPVSYTALAVILSTFLVSAVGFALGWRTRLSGAVLVVAIALTLAADRQLYSNHLYLLLLLVGLHTLAGAGLAFSLDAHGREEQPVVARWPVTLLKLQLTIVYGFATFTKLNLDYLSGGVLVMMWRNHGILPLPEALARFEVVAPVAIGAVFAELFLAFAFWSPRLLRPAIVTGVVLHVLMIVMVGFAPELVIFAVMMGSMYVLFVEGDEMEQRGRSTAALVDERGASAALPRVPS